ncbi:MAG: 2Fe-2S iron-sulfur cluster-binding protein [Bacteroidota bacterium]
MAKFHSLKVSDIRRETIEAVSISFEIPASLQPEYLYKHGQYITLKLNIGGEELRRSYSVCTSPYYENELRVAVKTVKDGRVSTYLNSHLKKGDVLEVMTPMGSFTSPLSGNAKKDYLLFAGGSGITPIMSILKSILHIEKQSTITLIYANRDENSVIFKREIDTLAEKNSNNLKVIYTYDNTTENIDPTFKGQLSIEKTKALVSKILKPTEISEVFICGPGPLMENIKTALKDLNITDEKIHIEYFSAVLDTLSKAESPVSSTSDVKSKVTVIQYGMETQFDLNTSGATILDAALDAGADVPFSCKGAVCCTCRAKVLEGKVKMDANFALTDGEVAQGFVLTCQAHPLTEKVVLDYDAM